jgi:two-component system, cell cycle sensor histidine kinase and response regulator CckA
MEKNDKTKKGLIQDLAGLHSLPADGKESRSETDHSLQSLQASETRYRRLFETAQDGILILDAETGEIVDVNPYMIDMLHYSYEEFIGMKLWEVSPFKDTVLNRTAFEELQDKGYIQYKDLPLETKEGKSIAVEFVSNVYKSNGDKVIQCNIRNITERKDANRKLQEAVIFQQRLIDALPVPIFYKDSEGRYLGCNSSFEELFGQKREQIIGKSVFELSPKEFAEIYHKKDLALLQDPGIQIYEAIVKDADGVVHNVIFHKASFLNMDGSVGGLIGAILDITERKRAEEEKAKLQEQFLQSQKMESVGRLAGGVAHDFNNMLGVILGHTEMAMEQVDPALPLHADLDEIRKATERSSDLTRQLLAFARKQTISPKVLDLNETVERTLKMLRRLLGEDIHLKWQPEAGLWQVKMDQSQIDQILANLCVNARDAISGVGKITLETENVRFDATYCADHAGFVPGEYVLLALSDDGCGMDKGTLSHLFEPFFTTKGIGKGTGLGLATVYGIVRQNNGFINVYSEPDRGTTFRIYLPRHMGKTRRIESEEKQEPILRGRETILVVEDEKALLELSKIMLEKQGYRVLTASTPGEAIRLAEKHTGEIHLLMTDVVMPEMNGRDLARRMLSLYPNLKCLFMSGYTADVIAHHGILEDGMHFLQKPFSRKDLAGKVREALDRK